MQRPVLLLTGIVLLGVAGFAVIWLGTGRELQTLSAGILADLKAGRTAPVYAATHPGLKASWSEAEFTAWWDAVERELGIFVEVVRQVGAREVERAGATEHSIELELGFMNGRAHARLDFLDVDGDPRLRQIWIGPQRAGTPEQVRELATRAVLARFDAGDFAGLHALLAPELQREWPVNRLVSNLSVLRARTGAVRQLERDSEVPSEDPALGPEGADLHVVGWRVTFEKTEVPLRIAFRDTGGRLDIAALMFAARD